MQKDIITQIKQMKNISDVIVLTHNIDYIFLQTVFISALKKCGHPNLTILADAQCAFDSYKNQSSIISGLGTRFRVIPVSMHPRFRFHPKAILLSGQDDAHLFVGSGNMTFGGVRENGEIWSRFDISDGHFGEFSAFRQYLNEILPFVGLPEEVRKDMAELYEEENHHWASNLGETSGLWFSPGNNQSLEKTIVDTLSGVDINKLIVCSPYFDKTAKAIKQLSANLGSPPTELYIQSNKSTLQKKAAKKLPENINLISVQTKKDDEITNRFIHAKWYAVESGNDVYLFHGSANCSNAALTSVQPYSNAELMVMSKLKKTEFESNVLSEIVKHEDPPVLIDHIEDTNQDPRYSIVIRAARYDFGLLKLAFKKSENVKLDSLIVNSEPVEYEIKGENELIAKLTVQAKSVVLTGIFEGEIIESNQMWVDDESSLFSNSKLRTIVDTIREAQVSQGYDPSTWISIFKLLDENLTLMTSRELRNVKNETNSEKKEIIKINKSLLTSSSYSNIQALPTIQSFEKNSSVSIYTLLLRSFGISGHDDFINNDISESVSSQEDEVDRKEDIPISPSKVKVTREPTANEFNKFLKHSEKIVDRICEPEYLSIRDPHRLGLDIQVIGLLLRKAFSMNWIEQQKYYELSHKVWAHLFFHSKENNGKGWLQTRFDNAVDQERFTSSFVSPMLTATLYAWFSAVPIDRTNVYSQRFLLSQILAMGRCPWLWFYDEKQKDQLAEDLSRIWNDSPCDLDITIEEFSSLINRYAKIGLALVELEDELTSYDIGVIRENISIEGIVAGDMLWQGTKGICLTLQDCNDRQEVEVLCLQEPKETSIFKVNFLIPIRKLLESTKLISPEFKKRNKKILLEFINSF